MLQASSKWPTWVVAVAGAVAGALLTATGFIIAQTVPISSMPTFDQMRATTVASHGAHLRLIAEASTATDPSLHLVAGGVPASVGPILACGLRYAQAEMFAFLAHCLPFAPRGLVVMLEPAAMDRERFDADMGLAKALGNMGFLVAVYAQRPSLANAGVEVLEPLVFHRKAPNVFLQLDDGNNPFVTGWHSADVVPMPAPVLVLGDPVTAGTHADFPALRNAGSPVVLVARPAPHRDADQTAEPASGLGTGFWHHSACSGGIAGALMSGAQWGDTARHDSIRQALSGAGEDGSKACRVPLYEVADGGSEAVAAALAVMLTRRSQYLLPTPDAVTDTSAVHMLSNTASGAVTGAGDAQAGTSSSQDQGSLRASSGSWGGKEAAMPPRAAMAVVEAVEPGALEVVLYGCGRVHGTILVQFLIRCLPGRRGLYVQAMSLQWDMMLYQRPQHMATAMAGQNMLVLYQQWGRASGAILASATVPGVFVADASLPFAKIQGAIVNVHSTMYSIDPASPAQWQARGNVVVYEYIDAIDEAISGDTTKRLQALKDSALASATMLVYSAEALRKDLVGPDGSTARLAKVPNGVDMAQYATKPDDMVPPVMIPVIATGKPIIGYFGAISGWIWLEVVEEMARKLPEMEFVMIGPSYAPAVIPQPSQLPPNLHYLGPVDAKQLVLYAKHWSVGIIPFRKGEIAQTTSPLKLFEYFALGLPVVVTDDMRECVQFSQVLAAGSPDSFVTQVQAAVERSKDGKFRETMRQLALQNSWDERAAHSLKSLTSILQREGMPP